MVKTAGSLFPGEGNSTSTQADVDKFEKAAQAHADGTLGAARPGHDAQENELVLLTLPVWVRRKLPPRYGADDPDWKAFQNLQQNQKLLEQVKLDVAKMVGKQLKSPKHVSLLRDIGVVGSLSMRIRLELVTPIYPPFVYEVPCIFVAPGKYVFGWRPLPESVGSKMVHIFHPLVFAKAFYAGLKEFWMSSYQITRARVADRLRSARGPITGEEARKRDKAYSPTKWWSKLTEVEKAHLRLPINRLSETEKKSWLPFLRGEYGEQPSTQGYRDIVKSMTYQGAIESACAVFRANWVHGQTSSLHLHMRDACLIEGSIECVGDRGKLHLDVTAVYSPETNSIIGPPLITKSYIIPDTARWHTPTRREERLVVAQNERPTLPSLKPSKQPSNVAATGPPDDEKEKEK